MGNGGTLPEATRAAQAVADPAVPKTFPQGAGLTGEQTLVFTPEPGCPANSRIWISRENTPAMVPGFDES